METISVTTMHQYLSSGHAVPLLPEGIPGPVHYAESWWAIPQDAVDYQPITDRQQAQRFSTLADRLATGGQAVQQERTAQDGGGQE